MTIEKPSYEELERRLQSYCKHDGGRTSGPNGCTSVCAVCGWDLTKCQHHQADAWDKYCRECGAQLKKGGTA